MIETLNHHTTRTPYSVTIILIWVATTGISGCSVASPFLTRSEADDATLADTTASTDHPEADTAENSQEFDLTSKTDHTSRQTDLLLTSYGKEPKPQAKHSATDISESALKQPSNQTSQGTSPQNSLITLGKDQSLDEKLKSTTGIVILDFYADWCGPCQRQSAVLKAMKSKVTENKLTIIKVNIDQHRQLTDKYKVSSLPTLIVVRDGNELRRQVGFASEAKMNSLIQL